MGSPIKYRRSGNPSEARSARMPRGGVWRSSKSEHFGTVWYGLSSQKCQFGGQKDTLNTQYFLTGEGEGAFGIGPPAPPGSMPLKMTQC